MSQIPAHIQALMAKANVAKTDEMTLSISVPRISTKGNRLKAINGEVETKLGNEFYGVIVGISPEGQAKAKTYYAAGWTEDSHEAPDCSSANGVVPDSWVGTPIHSVCATCPQNQWGSAESKDGKKAKACKESKRLHIVLADDVLKENPTVYVMAVTVNTFKNFTAYGAELKKRGLDSPFYVITKVMLDEESSVPRLQFEITGFLDEAPIMALLPIAEEKPWLAMTQTALPAPEVQQALKSKPVNYTPGAPSHVVDAVTGQPYQPPVTNEAVEALVNNW